MSQAVRRSLGGLLLVALACFFGIKNDWPAWYVGALIVAGAAMLSWHIARRQGSLLGPHFFYDLVRLARRSRTRDLRMLYGMALLLGLGLIYWIQFPHEELGNLLFHPGRGMTLNDGARFAEIFVF